jgi:hypothetical protein
MHLFFVTHTVLGESFMDIVEAYVKDEDRQHEQGWENVTLTTISVELGDGLHFVP